MGHCPNSSHEEWRQCLTEYVRAKPFSQLEVTAFTITYGLITTMGLLGNGLVIYVVISKRSMRSTRNVFIVNLAISNFLLAVIWIPFLWVPTYEVDFNHSVFFCKVAQAFPGINIYCSTLTISVIAIDRYFVVACSRFGADRLKVLQAVFISLGIWAIALVLSIPYLLFFDIDELIVPENISMLAGFPATSLFKICAFMPSSCSYTADLHEEKECKNKYEVVVNILLATFLYIVPLFVLFTFNFLLTKFLNTAERTRTALRQRPKVPEGITIEKRRSSARGRHSRTTALLFAMAITYAILWLPFTILSLYIHLGPGQKDERETRLADEGCKLISMLSICINPILYGYLNTNFNREFKVIFRKAFPFLKIDPPKTSGTLKTQMSGFSLLTKDSDSDRARYNHGQKLALRTFQSNDMIKNEDDSIIN